MELGMIGLGRMGANMARRLQQARLGTSNAGRPAGQARHLRAHGAQTSIHRICLTGGSMTSFASGMLCAASALLCTVALADPTHSPSRGELLYSTHCIACHTARVHWRDKKQATDWDSLEKQVRRWQAAGMLQWNEDDINEVTRHLNDSYYHFARAVVR
jgi:hypothetical protein